MKFKLFSAILLLVCFLFLGILSGAVPVLNTDAAEGPSTEVFVSVTPVVPTAAASPTPEITPSPEPTAEPSPEPTAEPTPQPTAEPEPTPEAVRTAAGNFWTPEARIISTTITWRDPLDNDTDYDIDGAALLSQSLEISLPTEGYQILIIHTHATEAYTPEGDDQYEADGDYRTPDADHNVIRVGEALAEALSGYGLNVLHDTGLYDYPSYNGSYARSEEAILGYLEAYPEIAMVIDLHRDALGDEEKIYRTVSDQVTPSAAQILFVAGSDVNLEYPGWQGNLALAMSLQALVENAYPHLTRPTLLCPYRYNQQLTPGSLLMEVGTTGNTLQEAITAVQMFADAVGPSLAARIGA